MQLSGGQLRPPVQKLVVTIIYSSPVICCSDNIFSICLNTLDVEKNMQKNYTVLPTLNAWLGSGVTMNYVSWFCVLYIISSYVRMYPNELLENNRIWGLMSLGSLLLSVASVIYCSWFSENLSTYYFVSDSNKILAVVVAFCTFNFFRTLNVPCSKVINAFGASTFGVLLIHAHSDIMRQWLWNDTLDNVGAYSLGKLLPVHAFFSVVGVFLICACIDMLRIRFIEKPLLAQYDRLMEKRHSK